MRTEGRHIEVSGVVQGVGFRPWVYRLAREAGLTGRVRNDSSGVTIDAFGSGDALDTFLDGLAAARRRNSAFCLGADRHGTGRELPHRRERGRCGTTPFHPADLAVHLNRDVPPGGGGIALGQALVADAIDRSGRTTASQDIASRRNG